MDIAEWTEYSHSSPRVIGDEESSLRTDPGEERKAIQDGTGSLVAGTRIGRISDDRSDVGRRDARRALGIHREV